MHLNQVSSHLSGSKHCTNVRHKNYEDRMTARAVEVDRSDVLRKQIKSLGLPRWRHHLKAELYEYILDNQRQVDQVVRGIPSSIQKQLKKYIKLEQTSLLELAVWKASCLWFDGSQSFHTMQDILDQWTVDERFDPAAYKSERRYTSSVAVIMHSVIQFLG